MGGGKLETKTTIQLELCHDVVILSSCQLRYLDLMEITSFLKNLQKASPDIIKLEVKKDMKKVRKIK